MRPGVSWGVLEYPWVSWGVLGYLGVSRGNQTDPYLLACPIDEDPREILQQRLFVGVPYLDFELLLNMKLDDEFKTDRTYILSELETFITNSKRFM